VEVIGHEAFMRQALDLGRRAFEAEEVPIGALLVRGDEVLAHASNAPRSSLDPTAHAEILVLREAASKLGNYRLPGTTLYVTVEPCLMCVGALIHARVARLVYGATESKTGAIGSIVDVRTIPANHRFEVVGGVMEDECRALMQEFFRRRRSSSDEETTSQDARHPGEP
jgi:tRNA(adenine34) deaminase